MKKNEHILNYLIIALIVFLEYAWFWRKSAVYLECALIALLFLIGLRIFFAWKKIVSLLNSLRAKVRTFVIGNKSHCAALIGILFLAFLVRLPGPAYIEGAMDADEAVEGIMAIHIYEGLHRPVTIYKMPVTYTIKSHLAALFFSMTGVSAKALQSVDFIFTFGVLIFIYLLAQDVFDRRTALTTLLFFAVPPSTLYYSCLWRSGEYVQILFFGAVALSLTAKYVGTPRSTVMETPKWYFSLIGFLWGVGFSTQTLMLAFIVSSLIVLFLKDIRYFSKHILWRLVTFSLVGMFPLLIWNMTHEWQTPRFLMNPPKAPLSSPMIERLRVLWQSLTIEFGHADIRSLDMAPVEIRIDSPSQLIVSITLLGLCAISLFFFFRREKAGLKHWALILVAIVTLLLNLRPARPGPNPRYMIALWACLPLFLCWWLGTVSYKLKWLVLLLFLMNSALGISEQSSYYREKDIGRMALISKLDEMGIEYVGAGYWQAYPITFLTKERIICSGRYGMPSSHARGDDPVGFERYESYGDKFQEALRKKPESCAFLFEGDSDYEREFISESEVPLYKTTVGRYKIYTIEK